MAPRTTCNSGDCRNAPKSCIFGDEIDDENGPSYHALHLTKIVLCFCLREEDQVSSDVPGYPSEAYAGFVVTAREENAVLAAGSIISLGLC